MKDVAPHDRPREKLERLGPSALGDNELLALVIGSGGRTRDALELANAVLAKARGLHGLPRLDPPTLRQVAGIGRAKAAQVLAAVELGRRTLVRVPAQRVRLNNPRDLAAYLIPQYGARPVEHFGIVMLDTKHRMIRIAIVAVGTLDTTVVHPREVFREATAACAAAIVLFHNHPSGDPVPSPEDVALTERLAEAGAIMGIDVVDHLILSDHQYFSMMEAGRIAAAKVR